MMRFKYTHLATWLKEQIKSGTYKDGDRIPTEIELAAQFGVSRDTVRKAISVLEKESLLRKIKALTCALPLSQLLLPLAGIPGALAFL